MNMNAVSGWNNLIVWNTGLIYALGLSICYKARDTQDFGRRRNTLKKK